MHSAIGYALLLNGDANAARAEYGKALDDAYAKWAPGAMDAGKPEVVTAVYQWKEAQKRFHSAFDGFDAKVRTKVNGSVDPDVLPADVVDYVNDLVVRAGEQSGESGWANFVEDRKSVV